VKGGKKEEKHNGGKMKVMEGRCWKEGDGERNGGRCRKKRGGREVMEGRGRKEGDGRAERK
jgi:hypothetical protein